MGSSEACRYFPGKRYEYWELLDPVGRPIEVVRQVRDEIRTRVEQLATDLLSSRT